MAQAPGSADAAVIAGTARITGHESIVSDGERITVPINGVMDFQTGSAALKIDLASLGLPVKGVVEARVVDQVMYMKLGDLLRGEKWCSPRDAGRNRKDSRS